MPENLKKFIADHLSQNCVKMSEHLNESTHLAEAASYLADAKNYPQEEILTLRIKLFDYYSCMRMFDVAHIVLAGIKHQMNLDRINKPKAIGEMSVGSYLLKTFAANKPAICFSSDEVEAEFNLLKGIQYRNYVPVQDFERSKTYFERSIAIYINLLNKVPRNPSQDTVNERFRAQFNLLGLYVNYDNRLDLAADLIKKMNKELQIFRINELAYLSVFHFVAGCYYLKTNNHKKALEELQKADAFLSESPERVWAANGEYKKRIDSKLEEASHKLGYSKEPMMVDQPDSTLPQQLQLQKLLLQPAARVETATAPRP